MKPSALLTLRRRLVGPSLRLAYETPLTIVRGEGAYLFDETGRAFLDMVNNVCHVGHCHPRVVERAAQQMSRLNTNSRYLHESYVRYAEQLTAKLPDPLEVVFLVCTGSEANDLALRLARSHTVAHDVCVLEGAYHGNTSSLIDISPYKFRGSGGAGCPPHVHVAPMPDTYRGEFERDDPEAGPRFAAGVAACIDRARAAERRLAAFFAESLLGCGGQIEPPPRYLASAFEHARSAGAVCVADEVQVGFGRVGSHFWAFERQAAVPDIVTLGKPIGNGHPLAAVVTTRAVADAFDNGMEYFNTFGGNPVSCAIGLAVLDVIEEEGLQENARVQGDRLSQGLKALAAHHALIGDVRGAGLFLGVELVRDRATLEPAAAEARATVEEMKARGILLSTDGPLENVLKIKPPLVLSEADVDRFLEELDGALTRARRA